MDKSITYAMLIAAYQCIRPFVREESKGVYTPTTLIRRISVHKLSNLIPFSKMDPRIFNLLQSCYNQYLDGIICFRVSGASGNAEIASMAAYDPRGDVPLSMYSMSMSKEVECRIIMCVINERWSMNVSNHSDDLDDSDVESITSCDDVKWCVRRDDSIVSVFTNASVGSRTIRMLEVMMSECVVCGKDSSECGCVRSNDSDCMDVCSESNDPRNNDSEYWSDSSDECTDGGCGEFDDHARDPKECECWFEHNICECDHMVILDDVDIHPGASHTRSAPNKIRSSIILTDTTNTYEQTAYKYISKPLTRTQSSSNVTEDRATHGEQLHDMRSGSYRFVSLASLPG